MRLSVLPFIVAAILSVSCLADDLEHSQDHASGYSYAVGKQSWLYVHRSWSAETMSQFKHPTTAQRADTNMNPVIGTTIYQLTLYKFPPGKKKIESGIGYFKLVQEGSTANGEFVMLAAKVEGDQILLCYRLGGVFIQVIDIADVNREKELVPTHADMAIRGGYDVFVAGAEFTGSLAENNLRLSIACHASPDEIVNIDFSDEGGKLKWTGKNIPENLKPIEPTKRGATTQPTR